MYEHKDSLLVRIVQVIDVKDTREAMMSTVWSTGSEKTSKSLYYIDNMSDVSSKFRERSWFESVYKIGVGVKGIDGLIELIVGVALWISPQIIHGVLSMLIGEASEHHNGIFRFIAEYIGHADIELAKSGLALIIIFLITHGVVKLALVYCLLKRIVRAYPIALAILVAFLLYQVYVFIIQPTIGMALFTILDAIIIWLVWGEYQDLRSKK